VANGWLVIDHKDSNSGLGAARRGRSGNDSAGAKMTGCLTKAASGEYVLANEAGEKVKVKGSPGLEKHSANHKVTLFGAEKTEGGKLFFQVERIEHLANTCIAAPAK
jgi:hypothetical protein